MKFSTLLVLLFFLFVICVRAQKLSPEMFQKTSTHVRITTLLQLPPIFQSRDVLRDRLVRFLDEGYFEGQDTGTSSIFEDPIVVPTLNKICGLLSSRFGVDGMSYRRMLAPFPMFKIHPNEIDWQKHAFFRSLLKTINSGALRPIYALFWVEDVDVADIALNNLLRLETLTYVFYEQSISTKKWINYINSSLQGFPVTREQKEYLIKQKRTFGINFFQLWLMKSRQFPIQNKKLLTELKINGNAIASEDIVSGLLNFVYSRDFIKISDELIPRIKTAIETHIANVEQRLKEAQQGQRKNKNQVGSFKRLIGESENLLNWLLNEQNK